MTKNKVKKSITKGSNIDNQKSQVILLDGNRNYIKVYVLNRNKDYAFYMKARKDSDDPAKFSNLELAKVTATGTFRKGTNFSYAFVIGNQEYDISKCQKIGQFYQLYNNKGKKIFIQEIYRHNVERIGYLCFENGDIERCDREYGTKRQKQLLSMLSDSIQYTFSANRENTISKIDKISPKEYILHVKNSTARIHIMTNSKIMDINQVRKHRDQRCIPFIKEVDKFLTLFVFTSVDRYERKSNNYEDKITSIIDQIMDFIFDNSDLEDDELKYLSVEFEGFIVVDSQIKSEVLDNDQNSKA